MGVGTGGGVACATSYCAEKGPPSPREEALALGAKLAATACASGSLDATVETIGDGAILATMIQSDAADYFGTVDNDRQPLWVPDDRNAKLNQILTVREPG